MTARLTRLALLALLWLTVLLWGFVAFAIDDRDATEGRAFVRAVERWQTNPGFRQVTREYVLLGGTAMRGRVAGMSADRAVIAFRSIPGLPDRFALVAGSDMHYRDFARGPLSAYLHLIGERDVPDGVGLLESLARSPNRSDEDVRRFLRSFKLRENVIATDAGALRGVRDLLTDIGADRPLSIRDDPTSRLMPHIGTVAASIGAPPDPVAMTPRQQQDVYLALDEQIRRSDPELWRTKQLVDLLCGIWGQAYGQTYVEVIEPALRIRAIARNTFPLALLMIAAAARPRRRRR